jgi:hypothetical protein
MAGLYFNRVPSLPATDDGSARPLAEDLSSGSGDGEDITWDADTAGPDGVPAAAITLTASHPLLGQAAVPVRSEPVKHASEPA